MTDDDDQLPFAVTNYDKATGARGTMRITDDGSAVGFWIMCSDPATTVGAFTWSGVVNGVNVGGTISLPAGFNTRLLGSWTVTQAQTVTFHINSTGTQGLGGPTDHAAAIQRVTVPPIEPPAPVAPGPPVPLGFTNVTTHSFTYNWRYGDLGNGTVTSRGCQWAITPDFAPGTASDVFGVDATGAVPFDGLNPGQEYWVRVRVQTTAGLGPWSPVTSQRTLGGVYVSDGTTWQPKNLNVSDGAAWKAGQLSVSDGATWKPAT